MLNLFIKDDQISSLFYFLSIFIFLLRLEFVVQLNKGPDILALQLKRQPSSSLVMVSLAPIKLSLLTSRVRMGVGISALMVNCIVDSTQCLSALFRTASVYLGMQGN